MTKVEEYLRNKRIKEQGLPLMYVVKSDRQGAYPPVERQVVEITESIKYTSSGSEIICDKYFMKGRFPYEITIKRGSISSSDEGYASGIGDLWYWSYYCTFSKDDAEQYYKNESKRISETYIK